MFARPDPPPVKWNIPNIENQDVGSDPIPRFEMDEFFSSSNIELYEWPLKDLTVGGWKGKMSSQHMWLLSKDLKLIILVCAKVREEIKD